MKLMIAYDGSAYADVAINDLPRAGFPRDAGVLVVSVVDFSTAEPKLSDSDLISAASRRAAPVLEEVRRYEAQVLKETRAMVSKVVSRIRRQFPEWTVRSEVLRGTPSELLLEKAGEWRPDLLMGGAQGRSAIGRFFLGSVSKYVSERAASSVRVVRSGFEKAEDEPIVLVLGVKTPAEAERVVKAVGQRVWPAETRIRLVAVDESSASGSFAAYRPSGKSIYENAADSLATVCLKVSVQIERGEAKAVFLEAADAWRADTIFVSAGSAGSQELDETAAILLTDSKCTVEIIR